MLPLCVKAPWLTNFYNTLNMRLARGTPMCTEVTIDSRYPRRGFVRDNAEGWLGNRTLLGWTARGDEELEGREVMTLKSGNPFSAIDNCYRTALLGNRGKEV
jgi:hypothetical protein